MVKKKTIWLKLQNTLDSGILPSRKNKVITKYILNYWKYNNMDISIEKCSNRLWVMIRCIANWKTAWFYLDPFQITSLNTVKMHMKRAKEAMFSI
jgi:hypothetical protein